MKLVYSLKLLSDLLFYLSFAGLVSVLIGGDGFFDILMLLVPCAVLLGVWANAGWLKFLSLAFLIPAALSALEYGVIHLLLPAPVFFYIVHYATNLPYDIKTIQYSGAFKIYMTLNLVISFVFIVYFPIISWAISSATIPYAIMFCASSVVLMHMVRHDTEILSHTRFKIVSVLSILSVFLLGAILGTERVVQALLSALSNVYVLFAILFVTLCAFIVFIKRSGYNFRKLLKRISILRLAIISALISAILIAVITLSNDVVDVELLTGGGYAGDAQNIWLIILLITISSIVLMMAVYLIMILYEFACMLYRLLMDKYPAGKASPGFERVMLNEEGPEKAKVRITDNQIRHIYRKFLKLCKLKRVAIETGSTTADIAKSFGHMANEYENAALLREIYIGIRYGEKVPGSDDIKKVQGIYRGLKRARDSSHE